LLCFFLDLLLLNLLLLFLLFLSFFSFFPSFLSFLPFFPSFLSFLSFFPSFLSFSFLPFFPLKSSNDYFTVTAVLLIVSAATVLVAFVALKGKTIYKNLSSLLAPNQLAAPLDVYDVPAAQEEHIPDLDPPLSINERAEEPAVAPPAAPADTLVDYDVVVDIPQLGVIDFPIFAPDRETLAEFEEGFTGKTIVSWGAYNAGKTFVLGRIFKVTFRAESLHSTFPQPR